MIGDYLHEFVVVARKQNMAQAALELGLSTSSLARHIASLEAELGANLVERTAGGVRLTEDGRYALAVAEKMCDLGEGLADRLRAGQY